MQITNSFPFIKKTSKPLSIFSSKSNKKVICKVDWLLLIIIFQYICGFAPGDIVLLCIIDEYLNINQSLWLYLLVKLYFKINNVIFVSKFVLFLQMMPVRHYFFNLPNLVLKKRGEMDTRCNSGNCPQITSHSVSLIMYSKTWKLKHS